MTHEAQSSEEILNRKVEALFKLLVDRNTMYHDIVSNSVQYPKLREDVLETKFGADEDGFSYEAVLVDVVDAVISYTQDKGTITDIVTAVDDVKVKLGKQSDAGIDLIEQAYRSADDYRDIDELELLVAFDTVAMNFVNDEEIDLTRYRAELARMICEDATAELKTSGCYNDLVAARIQHFRNVSSRIHLTDESRKAIEEEVILPAIYGIVVESIASNNGFNQDTEGLLEDARVAATECNGDAIVNESRVRTAISKRAKELISRVDDLDGALAQFGYVTRLNIGTEAEIKKSAEGVVASAYHKLLSMLDHVHDFTLDHEHYRSKIAVFARGQDIDTTKYDSKLVGRARARAIAYVKNGIQTEAMNQHEYQAQLNEAAETDATKFNNEYTQEAYRNVEKAVRKTLSASDYTRTECWGNVVSWMEFARDSITDKEFASRCEDRIFGMLAKEIKGATGRRSDMKRAKLGLTYIKELADQSMEHTGRNYSAQIVTLEARAEDKPGVLTHHGKTGWLRNVLRG